jgi:hypothetical protein
MAGLLSLLVAGSEAGGEVDAAKTRSRCAVLLDVDQIYELRSVCKKGAPSNCPIADFEFFRNNSQVLRMLYLSNSQGFKRKHPKNLSGFVLTPQWHKLNKSDMEFEHWHEHCQ